MGVMYYIDDEDSKGSLNLLFDKLNKNSNLDDVMNKKEGISIIPMSFFYGELKNELTPVKFSLNQIYENPQFINEYNDRFYLGNGIWLDNKESCLISFNNKFEYLSLKENIVKFDDLIESNYPIRFNMDEIGKIKNVVKKLNNYKISQTTGGLYQNYHNLNKYIIITLILITIVIIITIIIKLVANKNKIGANEKFHYNKNINYNK